MRPASTATPSPAARRPTRSSACERASLRLQLRRAASRAASARRAACCRRCGSLERRDLEEARRLAQRAPPGGPPWLERRRRPSPPRCAARRRPPRPRSTTLKRPIWPVASRWVPPHSSVEKSPIRIDAHAVAVLLAEQRHGAGARAPPRGPSRSWLTARVGLHLLVDQVLDLLDLAVLDRAAVREVEAQVVGRHQRAGLGHVGAEHPAQRRVEQVRAGVVLAQALAPRATRRVTATSSSSRKPPWLHASPGAR